MLRNLIQGPSNVELQPLLDVQEDTSGCVQCDQYVEIKLMGHGVKDNQRILEFTIIILPGARMTSVRLVQSNEVLVECVNDATPNESEYTFHAETEFNLGQVKNWSLRFSPHNKSQSNSKKKWMYTKGSGKKKPI